MHNTALKVLLTVLGFGLPALALAHPDGSHGAHGGFGAGFLHPLLGPDHLLALLGVGVWTAQQQYRTLSWVVPAAFLIAMLAGSGLGVSHIALPLVESGIVGSLVVVGLLVFFARQMPLWSAAGLVSLFAVSHGYAHGAEMAAGMSGVVFGSGFLIASALLLAGGAVAWRVMEARALTRPAARSMGLALLSAGAAFMVLPV